MTAFDIPHWHDTIPADFWLSRVGQEVYYYNQSLMKIIDTYGSPLKIFTPHIISEKIQRAQALFQSAISETGYTGEYAYCYCTKSSHFSFVLNEILRNNIPENPQKNHVHLETSSSFDADIIHCLNLHPDTYLIHNGFKAPDYIQSIKKLSETFGNSLCVLDNEWEIDDLEKVMTTPYKIGIRMATHEIWDQTEVSRLWIGRDRILPFVESRLIDHPNLQLKMLHFFMNHGIRDNDAYYTGLREHVEMYCQVKKICSSLEMLDIWGWLPIRFHFSDQYDYEILIKNIVCTIQEVCDKNQVPHPHIFTEFGSYTVGESAMNIYTVLREKIQKSDEVWYMVNSSFMTTIPDSWGLDQKFPVTPINHLDRPPKSVRLGGMTCDKDDYLTGIDDKPFHMPTLSDSEPLHIMVMHTGAYQENISGYGIGGLSHCQLDGEKILLMDQEGNIEVFFDGNDTQERLKTLGYTDLKIESPI